MPTPLRQPPTCRRRQQAHGRVRVWVDLPFRFSLSRFLRSSGADESRTHLRCQTFLAYSRREYDRTATIVTAPSECSLPARGCPGRTHYPIAVSSSSSYPCSSERAGRRTERRTERCQTPGPSRSSSRNRTQMSPPPSPSYYAPHIFFTAGTSFYVLLRHLRRPRRPLFTYPSPCIAKTRRPRCSPFSLYSQTISRRISKTHPRRRLRRALPPRSSPTTPLRMTHPPLKHPQAPRPRSGLPPSPSTASSLSSRTRYPSAAAAPAHHITTTTTSHSTQARTASLRSQTLSTALASAPTPMCPCPCPRRRRKACGYPRQRRSKNLRTITLVCRVRARALNGPSHAGVLGSTWMLPAVSTASSLCFLCPRLPTDWLATSPRRIAPCKCCTVASLFKCATSFVHLYQLEPTSLRLQS